MSVRMRERSGNTNQLSSISPMLVPAAGQLQFDEVSPADAEGADAWMLRTCFDCEAAKMSLCVSM